MRVLHAAESNYHLHTFANGIRFVYTQLAHTRIAHVAYVLDIGSRDEAPHQQGLAHFWEHMAFKGTRRRRAYQILNRLEVVGGELNAYTTKEKICFYASVLQEYLGSAIDLLTDITFDSVFPEKQIEREKGVILEEIAMYQDTPEEAIQDEFDSLLFSNHPLGYNILGTRESICSFTRNDFQSFIDEHMSTDRVVLAAVSSLPFEKVLPIASRYVSQVQAKTRSTQRQPYNPGCYQARRIEKTLPISQAHCMWGCPAYALHSPNRLPFVLLNNLLGGPAMSSRLNLLLRERYGYVYAIDSNYTPLSDVGIWTLSFAIDTRHLHKAERLIQQTLLQLCEQPLSNRQLRQAKNQLKGQLAMAEENHLNFTLMMAKSLLDYGHIDQLSQLFEQIDAIQADDLCRVAQDVFGAEQFCSLYYLPQAD